jgi:hypothetical protein
MEIAPFKYIILLAIRFRLTQSQSHEQLHALPLSKDPVSRHDVDIHGSRWLRRSQLTPHAN